MGRHLGIDFLTILVDLNGFPGGLAPSVPGDSHQGPMSSRRPPTSKKTYNMFLLFLFSIVFIIPQLQQL